MRAVGSVAWRLVLSLAMCVGSAAGCSPSSRSDLGERSGGETDSDETDPSGDPLPQDPLTGTARPDICQGKCTPEPPIPFNSKIHLVWIGSAASVADCPSEAPLPGFEGYVVSMADMKGPANPRDGASLWVRECLISTDSDTCTAGTTCAPLPQVDYRLCLSRENAGPCSSKDYPQQVVAQEWAASPIEPVTLCCAGNAPAP